MPAKLTPFVTALLNVFASPRGTGAALRYSTHPATLLGLEKYSRKSDLLRVCKCECFLPALSEWLVAVIGCQPPAARTHTAHRCQHWSITFLTPSIGSPCNLLTAPALHVKTKLSAFILLIPKLSWMHIKRRKHEIKLDHPPEPGNRRLTRGKTINGSLTGGKRVGELGFSSL